MARLDGSVFKLFGSIAKAGLILDDFGLTHLDNKQQMDLMEIIEDRHSKASTIIASQLQWQVGMMSSEKLPSQMRY